MQSLSNKTVLITGGTTGIGRAAAIAFASHGSNVVVAGRSEEHGYEAVENILSNRGTALFIQCDVTSEESVQELVKKTVTHFGSVDVAFNNAGVEGEGIELADTDQEVWSNVIDTNLKGVWLSMKYEIIQMLKQGHGSIINTSSVLGLVANRSSLYTASKHGVNGLTKSAAITYAERGIRVNAICPGYIDTPMVIRAYENNPQARNNAISRHPIGRLGSPEEVAEAAVWLGSDSASFVTGLMMAVDGGYSAK
jgi:NAD(P)-dependent dehydrogenase (short-subunit alcohol dehydrogenase family)